jgi:quinohemoprotein amine dehydrogenase
LQLATTTSRSAGLQTLGAALCLAALISVTPTAALAQEEASEPPAGAIPVTDQTVIRRCRSCHTIDEQGHMSRLSFERKTPEGWQISLRRMVSLVDIELTPEEARTIVRYLSNEHGLAPEEARPGFFEAERRTIEHSYEADEVTFETCKACHSLGRVITQRRSREEWELLLAMHRGYYPIVDMQAFRGFEPPDDGKYPMHKAIDHLSEAFPLDTPEWTAWQANKRPPRLTGEWALSGHAPGRGPVFGAVQVRALSEDELETTSRWQYARDGEVVEHTGRAIVYTGYQWRGRSGNDDGASLREVLFVERDWRSMSGRWFTGDYDEIGIDVTLARIGGDPVIAGLWPSSLQAGAADAEITVYAKGLPGGLGVDDVDLGPGVEVTSVETGEAGAVLKARVDASAATGVRDVWVAGAFAAEAFTVYDEVSRIEVRPAAGMARLGGVVFPKQLQPFEAVALHDGRDGEPGTDDDLELGIVDVEWSLAEYGVTYDDDDKAFVGELSEQGLFTPAIDGPNPERRGNRNNVGDVWVVARYDAGGERPLEARGHLLVTVPLYMRFDPWRATE